MYIGKVAARSGAPDFLFFTLFLFTLAGCWMKTVDGHTVNTSTYDPTKLAELAAFDLHCPKNEIKLIVLSDNADDVGAAGCGKQVKYVRVGATLQYVANTAAGGR